MARCSSALPENLALVVRARLTGIEHRLRDRLTSEHLLAGGKWPINRASNIRIGPIARADEPSASRSKPRTSTQLTPRRRRTQQSLAPVREREVVILCGEISQRPRHSGTWTSGDRGARFESLAQGDCRFLLSQAPWRHCETHLGFEPRWPRGAHKILRRRRGCCRSNPKSPSHQMRQQAQLPLAMASFP